MTALAYPHIELRTDGVPVIVGTRIKVVHLVLEQLAYHWDAYQIQRQHPDLSLAQIYAALAYYHDHQEELDRDIEERLRREEAIIAELEHTPLQVTLRQLRRSR